MKLRTVAVAVSLVMSVTTSPFANAATMLKGSQTADNSFSTYLSTNDSVTGSLVNSGNYWQTTYSFSTALTAGQNYFLHIVATDSGAPAGLLGSFAIEGTGFTFSNGGQTLVTNAINWKAVDGPAGGWTSPTGTPIDHGVNGVGGPWGANSKIDGNAKWIWSERYGSGTAYFSTQITAAVPEPETYAMLVAGLGLLGAVARRRKNKQA